jgi:acyl-CoA thioesterase FadM
MTSATGALFRTRLRPRYHSANIRTWIGFKQFMNLAEEAVVGWFRDQGVGPATLFHRYGLGLTVVDSSVQLPAVLEVDDDVVAEVAESGAGLFAVRLATERDGELVRVMRGRITVALVRERHATGADEPPAGLAPPVVDGIGPFAPSPSSRTPRHTWTWTVRYPHCHFSDRVAHSAYVAALEEMVDRALAAWGVGVPRMLADRSWIPVVSRARVQLLADAYMDDEIETTFAVDDIVGGRAFDATMRCVAHGPSGTRPVAEAHILHGYAVTAGPLTGTLAELDSATVAALRGTPR